jgi:hypothetical protein
LEAAELLAKVREANGVMEDAVGAIVIGVGAPYDTDDGEILTVGASNGIEDAKATDSEGNNASTHAMGSGIAICSISCIELIAAANEPKAWF